MAQDIISKIREAASSKGVDPDVAVRIAELESSLDPTAKAKRSSARGLFQVIDDTWKRYGGNPAKRFDVDENIRVGTDILADNAQRAKRTLGRDPRPSELYAMHFFGGDVGLKVARSPEDRPLHALVTPSVLRANPQLKGKTAGQLMAGWEAKFPAAAAPVAVATAAQSEEKEPGITRVSRSVPRPLTTAKPIPMQSAELPASYQAALAVSLLASDEEKEKTDENEPSVAEQFLAQAPRTTALAGLDLGYQSPFPEPTPVRMAEGGVVPRGTSRTPVRMQLGGMPNPNEIPGLVDPRAEMASESQRMLNRLKAQGPRSMGFGNLPPGIAALQRDIEQRQIDAAKSGSAATLPLIDRPGMLIASDIVRGATGTTPVEPTNPSEANRLMQALTGAYLPTAPVVRTGQAAGAAIRQPTQSLVAAGQALEELGGTAAEQLARLSRPNALGSQAGVIKAKGGNWPARHIQMRLDQLRSPMFYGQDPELRNAQVAEQIDELRDAGASEQVIGQYAKSLELPVAIDKWITNKLGKYIQNEMGTPKDPLRKLAREENITTIPPELINSYRDQAAKLAANRRELATSLADYRYRATLPDGKTDTFITMKDAEDWVAESNIPDRDKAYATIKAFVRDENYDEDPVRGLTPEGQPILESGKPAPFLPRQEELNRGPAKYWEDLVDSLFDPVTKGQLKAEIDLVRRGESTTPLGFRADETLAELSRISPNTPIYQLKPYAISTLGFDKLKDGLEQMVSEPTLLPQALRIEPKDLDRMSVPDVVKRVDAFKNWQDEQYRKEILAKAANIPLYKEYDDGARWLRMTDLQDNKENRKYALAVGCDAKWCTKDEDYIDRYTDPKKAFWPRELHVLTSKDGRPLVQVLVELPDPAATGRASRPAIHEIKYRRNEPDIPEIGYGFDRKKVKHEVLSHVQDYIRSGDFRYVDELDNAKLIDTAPYGDDDFAKHAEDVRRFGWDEQAFGPWQRFVDADSWNEAVARMQMNMRGPQLQLRNPPEEFSEGGSANVPRGTSRTSGTSQTSSKLSRADLEALKKISEKSPEYRDITSYLEASGTPYPEIRADIAAQDASYDPRSNTVTLNFDAYRQLFDTKNPPPNRTFLHEMTHAAQPAMEKQYQEGTKFFAASPKDPEARRVFLQAYEKLRGSGAADLARKLDPTWEKENRKYRSSREELEAFGVGNVQNFGRRGDRLDARGPLHLDPTMATETMLLLDLARRDARLNKPTK